MERLRELFRFDGRLSRMEFWRAYLRVTILGVLAWGMGLFAILAFGRIGGVFMIPMVAVLVANTGICVRRLHDRGRTGWLLLVLLLFPVLTGLWLTTGPGATASPLLVLVLSLLSLISNIWGLVEIGFRRGVPGPNRYGEETTAA